MSKSPTAIKIIEIRKQIIANLNRIDVMRAASLYRTLIGLDLSYNKTYFKKDIEYLLEKGYIKFVDVAIGGDVDFDNRYIKLTAAGNEIANGINIDPALEI